MLVFSFLYSSLLLFILVYLFYYLIFYLFFLFIPFVSFIHSRLAYFHFFPFIICLFYVPVYPPSSLRYFFVQTCCASTFWVHVFMCSNLLHLFIVLLLLVLLSKLFSRVCSQLSAPIHLSQTCCTIFNAAASPFILSQLVALIYFVQTSKIIVGSKIIYCFTCLFYVAGVCVCVCYSFIQCWV